MKRALPACALVLFSACGASHHERGDGLDAPAGTGGDGGHGAATNTGGGGGTGGSLGARGGTGGDVTTTEAGAGGECQRDVSLAAVTLGEPAPFDLVIVADHSESLAWSRDELSSGLSELFANMRGRAVRVFLLTPTQYGASSAAAVEPLTGDALVPWQDPATGKAYADAVTTYSQSCTDPDGAPIDCPSPLGPEPYNVTGTWSFQMPPPVAELTPDMTDSEFDTERNAVKDAILAIGGSGSPHEQPLCTLSRYVTQPRALLPKNAVFLVISDEDDVSTPRDCLVGFSGHLSASQNENGSTPCSTDCDAYRYSMQGETFDKEFDVTCAAYDDLGNLIPNSDQHLNAYQGQSASCAEITDGPCTDAEQASVSLFCDSGKTVRSCTRSCGTVMGATCRVDLKDPSVNPCTGPFDYQGQTYADLGAYCATRGSNWQGCGGGGVNIQYSSSLSGGSSRQSLMPGTTTTDIANYFRSRVSATFAPDAYLLEGIVFEPSFGCTLGMGQSMATNLGAAIGDASHLFPLCQTYAPALDGVFQFAQALIQTEFTLSLKDDEDVTAVVVIDENGRERTLPAGDFAYDRATRTLTLTPGALAATDATLRVEVTSDCRPIVR